MTDQARYISGPVGDALGKVFPRSGYFAVSFFFVLSGFVLTWSHRPNDTATGFWRRRLVRIYPNHLVTYAMAVVLMLIAADQFTTKGLVSHLFLAQTWKPDVFMWKTLNVASWSLSGEVVFYLCFPLLLVLLSRLPIRGLLVVGGVLAAAVVSVPFVSQHAIGGIPLPFAEGSSFEQMWFVYLFPPVRALECVLGMVVARLVLAGVWPRIPLSLATLFAVGGYVVNLSIPYLYVIGGLSAIWIVPLVGAAASADLRGSASLFRGRTLVWLGDLTFAFYMIQGLVVAYAFRWYVYGKNLSPAAGIGAVVVVFVISLALAYALYSTVEQPLMRRFSRPRRRVPTLVPVDVSVPVEQPQPAGQTAE